MSDALYAQYAQGYNPLTQMNNVIGFQRQQTALQQQRFDLQQAQLAPAYSGLMALRTNPNAGWNDVNAALANSARLGGDITGMVANASAAAARGETPADFIRNESLRGVPSFEQLGAVTPGTEAINTGAGTQFGTVGASGGPTPGQFTPTQFVPRQLSVQDLAQPTSWQDAQGNVHTGTMADWYRYRGVDPSTLIAGQGPPVFGGGAPGAQAANYGLPGGSMGAGGNNIPGAGGLGAIKEQALMNVMLRESGGQNIPNAQGSPAQGYFQIMPPQWQEGASLAGVDTKQYPNPMSAPFPVQYQVASALYDAHGTAPWAASAANAGRFPGAQAAAIAARGVAGGAAGVPVGGGGTNVAPSADIMPPSPYLAPQFKLGAEQYAADTALERTLPQRTQPLINVLGVLHNNPNLQGGPGQQELNQWQTALRALGIDAGTLQGTTGYQEVAKYLAQNMRGQPGANNTDLARLETEAASPNMSMRREAIEELAGMQIGMERMRTAGLRQFNSQYPNLGTAARDAQNYTLNTADWQANQDPVAYAADVLPLQATQDYRKGLPSDALRRRWTQSYLNAKRLYGITLPGTGG